MPALSWVTEVSWSLSPLSLDEGGLTPRTSCHILKTVMKYVTFPAYHILHFGQVRLKLKKKKKGSLSVLKLSSVEQMQTIKKVLMVVNYCGCRTIPPSTVGSFTLTVPDWSGSVS